MPIPIASVQPRGRSVLAISFGTTFPAFVFAAVVSMFSVISADAATYTWAAATTGTFQWQNTANWSGGPAGTYPGQNAGDAVSLSGIGSQDIQVLTLIPNAVTVSADCSACTIDIIAGGTISFTGASVVGVSNAPVLKVNGGTLTIANAADSITVGNSATLSYLGGTIGGPGNLTVNGSFQWTGGTMSGTGTTSIGSTATGTIAPTAGYTQVDTRTFTNAGSLTYAPANGYYLYFLNNSQFNNSGTFNATADGQILHSGGTTLTNSGTFEKTGGTSSLTCNLIQSNGGTLKVNAGVGSIILSGGGSSSGTLDIGAGSTMDISTGTLTFTAATFPSAGALRVTGGTMTVSGNITVPNLMLSSGTINGASPNVLTVNSLTWTGGTMTGTGATTIPSAGSVSMVPTTYTYLDGRTFNNGGTFTYTPGAYFFNLYNGAQLNNANTFNVTSDGNIGSGGTTSTITNNGMFEKTGGTTVLNIINGVAFNNTSSGSIVVSSGAGSIAFNGGGSSAGMFNVAAGATVDIPASTFTISAATWASSGALRVNGGTVTINGNVVIQNVILSSGTINGSADLNVPVSLTWSGGTMSGSGSTTIPTGGSVTMTPATYTYLDTRTFNNAGTFTYGAGTYYLNLYNGAQFNNTSVFNTTGDGTISYGGATSAINNSGTFEKTGGTAALNIGGGVVVNNNAGTLKVGAGNGSFIINGGGGSTNGVIDIGAGSTLDLPTSTFTLSGSPSFPSAGALRITGATLTVSGSVTVPTLVLSNGTINGASPNVLTINALTWSGGTMTGTGSTVVSGPSALTGTANYMTIDGRAFKNNAVLTYNPSTTYLQIANGAMLTNAGTFDIQTDQGIYAYGTPSTFTNTAAAILQKSAGSGVSVIYPAVDNAGAVKALSGTLTLNGGDSPTGSTTPTGSSTGSFTATAPGTLGFGGGTFVLTATSSAGGTGTIAFTGGTVNLAGTYNPTGTSISGGTANFNAPATTSALSLSSSSGVLGGSSSFTVSGATTWSSGTMNGTGSTVFNGPSALTGASGYMTIDGRALTNNGTLTYNPPTTYLQLANGAVVTNNGTFDIQSDQGIYAYGTPSTFTNSATAILQKSAGTATSVVYPAVDNAGTVKALSGTLSLLGGDSPTGSTTPTGTSTGAFIATAPGTFGFGGGTFVLTATSSAGGTGTIAFSGGTANLAGTYNTSATAISGGTANFNAPATTSTLNFSNGTLGGSSSLTVSGATTWSGGTMNGTGSTVLNGASTLNGTTNYMTIDGRAVTNNAVLTYNTPTTYLQLANGVVFTNNGTFDIQSDQLIYAYGTASRFANTATGIFQKSAGTATTSVYAAIDNAGTVKALSGTLNLLGGDSPTGSATPTGSCTGAFIATAPGTLGFGGGTFVLTATSSGGGTGTIAFSGATVNLAGTYNPTGTSISGGTANFNAPATTATLNFSGGTLGGSSSFTVSSSTTWSGGTMTGTGSTVLNGTAAFTGTTTYMTIDGRAVTNNTTLTYNPPGSYLQFANGAAFTNNGTFDIQSDQGIYAYGTPSAFANAAGAILQKSGGTASSNIYPAVDNAGTVKALSGTLALLGGNSPTGSATPTGTSPGSFLATSPGILNFAGGTDTLTATASVGGTGTIAFSGATVNIAGSYSATATTISGGTARFNAAASTTNLTLSNGALSGSGTFTINGPSTWSAGSMGPGGSTVVAAGTTLTMTLGAGYPVLDGRTLTNNGTFNFSGCSCGYYFSIQNVATLVNNGTFDNQADQIIYSAGTTPNTINNSGTFQKSATSTGTTTIYTLFNNTGTVKALAGTMAFDGGLSQNAGALTLAGGTISSPTTITLSGGTLNGSGTVAANISNSAAISPGTPTAAGAITITGTYTQNSTGALNIKLGGASSAQYDQLNISGAATLGGTLNVSSLGGFTPVTGNTFTVLSFASKTLDFTTENGLNFGSGVQLIPQYSATALNLVTNATQADLSVAFSGAPASACAGSNVAYSIVVTNGGGSNATNVTLTDSFTGAALVSATSTTGTCSGTNPVTCAIGSLASGASATITVTLNGAGPISDTAQVSATEFDPNTANNSATASTTINAVPAATITASGATTFCAGGSVTLTASAAGSYLWSNGATTQSITVSTSGSYSVTVTTGGCSATSAAKTVTVNPLPSATITAPASLAGGSSGTASVASGAPGTTYSWTVTGGTINSGQGTNSISFTAGTGSSVQIAVTVTASGCSSSGTATVVVSGGGTADLAVAQSGPASVKPNQNATITVTVRNLGPGTATNVTLTDLLGGTFVSISSTQGTCSGTTTSICSLGTLTAGGAATVTVVMTATNANIRNNVSVSANETDPNPSNNSAALTIPITTSADVSVVKSGPSTASLGGTATYTITVSNAGPSSAGSIVVSDPTPAGLTLNSVSGACSALPCTISLGAGSSATITARYNVASGSSAPSQVTNTASVSSSGDPNSSNNTSTVTTALVCSTQPPTLVAPLTNTVVNSPIVFSWTAVNSATVYEVFVTQGGTTRSLGTTSNTKLSATVPTGAFSWFVVATTSDCGPLTSVSATVNACNGPDVPLASVIANAATGQTYAVQWTPVNNAGSYEVQEATAADFSNATTQTVTGASATYTHVASSVALPFFYRVRAVATCDTQQKSGYSPTVRIVIAPSIANAIPNANVPAGSTKVVVQEIHVPGIDDGNSYTFSATADKPWMTVAPPNGVLPPLGINLQVSADPSTLTNGTFTGTVIVAINPATTSSSAARTNGTTTVSLPVSVSLVTPVTPTSPTATAANALVIPSVGHLDGQNAQWQSDVRIANPGFSRQQYELTFTPTSNDASIPTSTISRTTVTVDAGGTVALDDIAKNWFGVGSLGEAANGVLILRPLSAANAKDTTTPPSISTVVASSRTYSTTATGTFGQFIPAIPFSAFVGAAAAGKLPTVLSLQQIVQSPDYRTNVGLVEAAGAPAAVTLSVFDDSGNDVKDIPLVINAFQQLQLNAFLASQGITLSDGRIAVKVTSGTGKITAYASVVDNRTNDPLLVSGVPLTQTLATDYVLPGVADLSNGSSSWRSDVRVFNSGSDPQQATLTLYPLGGGTPLTATTNVNPGEVKLLDGVVQSLFGVTNVGGALHVTTPTASSLVVSGRTYNTVSGGGTYGQFIPAVTQADAVGAGDRTLNILQVEDSPRYRTNVGVTEVTGQPATAEITVYLPDSKATPRIDIPLAPNEYRQFPIIQQLGLGNVYNARVSVNVVGGTGKITAYGSLVDQQTQAPTYVPAQ